MSKIVDIRQKLNDNQVAELIRIAGEYDAVTVKFLEQGIDIVDVAGVMANRLGEIVRVFEGDKEAFEIMLYTIMNDRLNLEK